MENKKCVIDYNDHKKTKTPAESDAGYIGNFIPLDEYESLFLYDNRFEDLKGKTVCTTSGKIYFTIGYNGLSLNCTSEGYVSTDLTLNESFSDGVTLAAWIKLVSFPSLKSLGNSPIIANKAIGVGDGGIVFSVVTEDKTSIPRLSFEVTSDSGTLYTAEALMPENSRRSWVHVAASLTPDKMRLFINFEEVAALDISDNIPLSSQNPFIIAQDTTGNHPSAFESELDDLLIRRGAISDDELESLRQYYLS
ncbi:MAG: LamG domain-containing protein [Ruminococcaceae bacterium]|nr:LamG domain-containing protein [Oscillospiraceae bacterium]